MFFYMSRGKENSVSAVQGHPGSMILVPIESAYATYY